MFKCIILPLLLFTSLEALVDKPLSIRAGAGAFFPECNFFSDIYGTAPIYHVEVDYAWRPTLSAFANVSFLRKTGKTVQCGDRTILNLTPLSAGLLVTSNAARLQGYFGGGIVYSLLTMKDFSPHVVMKISNHGFGGVLKSGVIFSRGDLSLQFFLDALLQKFRFQTSDPSLTCHHANLNAIIIGGAIGLRI